MGTSETLESEWPGKPLPHHGLAAYSRDALTGLLSPAGFSHCVRHLLDDHPKKTFALVYGDLDRFKVFNDLYGIEAGDELLVSVAALISEILPSDSAAARLRADHFVACVPRETFDPERFLDKLDRWFASYPVDFRFFVRLGIYRIDDSNMDVTLMSDRALIALREAKKSTGVNSYVFYDSRLRETLIKEQEVAGDMSVALEQGQFVPFFQPQYRYSTGEVVGAEVLARWFHPDKGLLAPIEFIPVFERNGLIAQLDYYLWEEACKLLRVWLDDDSIPSVPRLSVNISRVDIYCEDLSSFLKSLVETYGIPPDMLHLEITETAYMEAPRQLIGVVEDLRKAGFTVEMDDFGSGFSALNTLNDVPVDVLKLDMGFLEASSSTRGGIILASIVRMARWLDLSVIAEGVETRKQADYLASIGCDMMQGFLFSHPLDRVSFEDMLRVQGVEQEIREPMGDEDDSSPGIWDAESHFSLLFNRFVGPAILVEYSLSRNGLEIIRGNEAFRRWLTERVGAFEACSTRFFDTWSAKDREAMVSVLDRLAHEGGAGECEVQIRGKGGEALWIGIRMKMLARRSDVCSVFMQFEETTERQILRDRLRATIDCVPGGILFIEVRDGIARLLDFSDAAAELSDCTRDEYRAMAGSNAKSLIADQDCRLIETCIENLVAGQDQVSCTVRIRCRGGGFRWVHVSSSVMYRTEDALCIVAVLSDVSKEREAQRRLELQADMQERLYDTMPCGILRYTAEDELKLVSINQTGCDMFACADSAEFFALAGNDVFGPLSSESKVEQLADLEKLKRGTEAVSFVCRGTRKDGTTIWVEGNSSFTEGLDGERIVQASFNDVTAQRLEQHERDMERYASVLCSVYDEVIEFDCARNLCRLIYSAHRPYEGAKKLALNEALGRWLVHVPDPADRARMQSAVASCADSGESDPVGCSYRLSVGDSTVWCQTSFLRMSDDYVLWCNKDVSERISAEDRRMSERISGIVSKLPVGVGVYRYEPSGATPLYLSDRMRALFGRSREDDSTFDFMHQNAIVGTAIAEESRTFDIDDAIETGIDIEFEIDRGQDAHTNVHLQGRAVREGGTGDGEESVLLYVVATDVTEAVEERRAASWLNERYRILSELTHAISFDYNVETDTVLLYIDKTGNGMEAQVIPRYIETLTSTRSTVVHPDSIETVRAMFERVRKGAEGSVIEYQADYYGRGFTWYRTNLFVVSDDYGSRHLVGLIEDIQNEFDLRKKAELDETTGLTNHATAKDLVNYALSDPLIRANSVCAVLDIDDFKLVNDTCGHIEGDALLHEVGTVLRSSFRETDIVGRVGGDEFILLLKTIDLDVALDKLRGVAERVSEYSVPGLSIAPSLSVGVYKIGSGDLTYRDAFVKADDALYRAKRAGKNRIVVYQGEGDDAEISQS